MESAQAAFHTMDSPPIFRVGDSLDDSFIIGNQIDIIEFG